MSAGAVLHLWWLVHFFGCKFFSVFLLAKENVNRIQLSKLTQVYMLASKIKYGSSHLTIELKIEFLKSKILKDQPQRHSKMESEPNNHSLAWL